MNIAYKTANTADEFKEGKKLFQQYAKSLELDLSFQNFANELETMEAQYNRPKGALILAYEEQTTIGCVAIREINTDIAELKRMFVLPEYRKYKIGKKLLELSIEIAAKEFHYKKIRLDTLPSMSAAQKLYQQFDFYQIPPYRFNPVEGTVFMEKDLTGRLR
jgi:putative acetyltransferase